MDSDEWDDGSDLIHGHFKLVRDVKIKTLPMILKYLRSMSDIGHIPYSFPSNKKKEVTLGIISEI